MVDSAAAPDWLAACRRIAAEVRAMLAALPGTAQRAVVVGRGEGGDSTLVIDQAAEDLVFAELERLHEDGARFLAVSEERGEVDFGGGPVCVVIDPIDGSMNAKRGLSPHAVSIAVADGPTMADVSVRVRLRAATGEEWTATRGGGARPPGSPDAGGGLRVALALRTSSGAARRGLLELVAIEAAHPHLVAAAGPALTRVAHRTRTSARSRGRCASSRADGSTAWRRCGARRSVDVAAAQLIVRESGAWSRSRRFEDPLAAPLDLASRSPVSPRGRPPRLPSWHAAIISGVIDWTLVRRIAESIAGDGGSAARRAADLAAIASDAEARVRAYTRLVPMTPLPVPEMVSRHQWIEANVRSMRPVLDRVGARVGRRHGAARPPGAGADAGLLSAQVGGLTGFLAQRVLGQYDMPLLDSTGAPRLLMVGPNLGGAAERIEADAGSCCTG